MAKLRVLQLTNRDERFYPLLGPFLAKRAVHEAIGLPPWDDDDKHWVVALYGNTVQGFGGAIVSGEKVTLCSDYVAPTEDLDDVLTALVRARVDWARDKTSLIVATVVKAHQQTYRMAGFSGKAKTRTKNFLQMEKAL